MLKKTFITLAALVWIPTVGCGDESSAPSLETTSDELAVPVNFVGKPSCEKVKSATACSAREDCYWQEAMELQSYPPIEIAEGCRTIVDSSDSDCVVSSDGRTECPPDDGNDDGTPGSDAPGFAPGSQG